MKSTSTRQRLIAVLLLPFLMVLAGCGKLHADFDIQDVDTINVSYDLGIDKEFTDGVYATADEMCSEMAGELSVGGELAPDVEPYEEDGQLGCLVTGVMTRDNFGSDMSLTKEGGEYHLILHGDESMTSDLEDPSIASLDFDFRMTFTFPGKVIESNGGEVDGNSVTYTDLNEVAQGIDIRADAGGFPWVIVIVIVLVLGFLLLLLIAVVAFFLIRARKNKGGGSTPSGMPGSYGSAAAAGAAAPAAPQGQPGQPGQPGQQWGQASPPAAPQGQPGQPGQQGQQWGQASPPAAPQGEQPWSHPPQDGQQWGQPGQGQQPPQNPGW
ncbi:hypothetical protein CFK39_05980 [Brachybacterium avium]|uniref:LppM domain-containing protein n=1 Tax=Brachybacterium avium TaxID=2017485 RepID=A0A220UBM7_9MICO|nr:hypothetical protein [Brachybacterium avium]ASK65455.1 hypothetical protein CFK39_05980 [Brachybacterium avium]